MENILNCRLVAPSLELAKIIDIVIEKIDRFQEWNAWARGLQEKAFPKKDLLDICL